MGQSDYDLNHKLGGGGLKGVRRLPGNVLLFNLLERVTVTAVTVSDTVYDQMVISDAAFEALGPSIQDINFHAELRNTNALFECRVAVQRKFLDGDWQPAPASLASGDLLYGSTLLTADGYFIPSAVFSDRSRFGVATRLLLQYHAKSTGGGIVGLKSEITMSAAVRLFCC